VIDVLLRAEGGQITNHTEWWVLWLPLAGSALVAVGAIIGVVLSNRTTLEVSRQEREGARQRDYLQWRRQELRRLGGEVVQAGVDAVDEYTMLPARDFPITKTRLGPIYGACRRIAANGETLRFLAAPVNAARCFELRDLILGQELMSAAKEYQAVRQRDREAGLSAQEPSREAVEAESDFHRQLQQVWAKLRGFGQALESALGQLDPPLRQLDPPEPPALPEEKHF
jgi:hypothetical protein